MTNFARFLKWLKWTVLVLVSAVVLGGAVGSTQPREWAASTTPAYDEELRARWHPSDPPEDIPEPPTYIQGQSAIQMLETLRAHQKWGDDSRRAWQQHVDRERQRKAEAEEGARAEVVRRGCPGCSTQAEEYGERAALLALLPAAIALWFLLLSMLGQMAGTIRGGNS